MKHVNKIVQILKVTYSITSNHVSNILPFKKQESKHLLTRKQNKQTYRQTDMSLLLTYIEKTFTDTTTTTTIITTTTNTTIIAIT